jgi:hypothetical protein
LVPKLGGVSRVPSFDVVSQVDLQEVRNAVDQAGREVGTRYDFKGTSTSVHLTDEGIALDSSTEDRLKAAIDVLKERLVHRKVSLKSLAGGVPQAAGGARYKALFTLNKGLDQDAAREISKKIREMAVKVQSQINGDLVRVSGKKRDDLQEVIAELRTLDFRLPLQFVNFRE